MPKTQSATKRAFLCSVCQRKYATAKLLRKYAEEHKAVEDLKSRIRNQQCFVMTSFSLHFPFLTVSEVRDKVQYEEITVHCKFDMKYPGSVSSNKPGWQTNNSSRSFVIDLKATMRLHCFCSGENFESGKAPPNAVLEFLSQQQPVLKPLIHPSIHQTAFSSLLLV